MSNLNLQALYAGACANPGTKKNPYDYNSMIKYLADKENTSTHTKISLDHLDEYKELGVKLSKINVVIDGTHWRINGCHHINGGERILEISANGIHTEVSDDEEFDEIYYNLRKTESDFDTNVELVGKHKYSEGGGWYTKRQLYKVDNKYFCNV